MSQKHELEVRSPVDADARGPIEIGPRAGLVAAVAPASTVGEVFPSRRRH